MSDTDENVAQVSAERVVYDTGEARRRVLDALSRQSEQSERMRDVSHESPHENQRFF